MRFLTQLIKYIIKRIIKIYVPDFLFKKIPDEIIIEPTNVCNLKCPVCPTTFGMHRKLGFMEFDLFKNIIDALESKNFYPKNKFLCEPNLGKRGLMSTIGKKFKGKNKVTKNFLAYSDGKKNLFEICDIINISLDDALYISNLLREKKLI